MIEPMRLETPPFPEPSKQMMASVLNDYVQLENPLDYHTFIWGQREDVNGNTGSDYRVQFSLKVNFDTGDLTRFVER